MYAMVSTRPDISHVVGVVNRHMENIGKEHWELVKWVLQYFRGTSTYCITYKHVRDLTSLTPHVGRIIYFHVIKANINKA
jgi:hypothetical protein